MLLSMIDAKNRIEYRIRLMEEAALSAGRHLIQARASNATLDVKVKSDFSIVLNLDLEAQKLILGHLGNELPIVAEEDEESHGLINKEADYFLVDPVDGTTSCKRFLSVVGGQVGFGPLLGLVQQGELCACTFYNVPQRTLFTAVRTPAHGSPGSFELKIDPSQKWELPAMNLRRVLRPRSFPALNESAVLFFPGKQGEVRLVEYLRTNNLIENVYRFGGFANDCSRLCQGSEQIQIQFSAKPWDYSAVLLPVCAGYEVICDPLKERVPFEQWGIRAANPLLVAPPGIMQELLQHFGGIRI
jgi:fructose-1,6-bisphosphatase/inositol monophosphatase family enzyme